VAAFFKPENIPTPPINSNIMTLDHIINMLEGETPITAEQRAEALEVAKNFNAAKFTQAEVDAAISAATNPLQAAINQLEEEKTTLAEKNTSLETSIEEIKGGAGAQQEGEDDTPPINTPINYSRPLNWWKN
jgi:chromosome segregation ATPase